MRMVLSREFDCQSRESAGRFAEVEVRSVVVFTGVGEIESVDTDSLRQYVREGMERFVKFKKRDTLQQEPKKEA